MYSHERGEDSGGGGASNEEIRDESQSSSSTLNPKPNAHPSRTRTRPVQYARLPPERSAKFLAAGEYDPYMPTLPPSQSYSDKLREMAETYIREENKVAAVHECEYTPRQLEVGPEIKPIQYLDDAINSVANTDSGHPTPELEDRLLRWTYSLLDAPNFKQFSFVNSFEELLLALMKLLEDSIILIPRDLYHYTYMSEFVLKYGEEHHYDAFDSAHKDLQLKLAQPPSLIWGQRHARSQQSDLQGWRLIRHEAQYRGKWTVLHICSLKCASQLTTS
ncbi:uncharacterized protein BDZ99DRAFT_471973 [Mytilinidion resinicola]|uniref:Uncharacterized protein n=1 Tax=Mytilinidion resinicola TaxID=574789 RepID=A0A6A6Z0L2_9PEZI|nr:uncharacterized protein BDZ99DRAFT_471973 [Mytilinidion resinicola]KAF2814560.1 hypothetical protein BDZ99DRAFT_471973 [Mytilinidion resinicola]